MHGKTAAQTYSGQLWHLLLFAVLSCSPCLYLTFLYIAGSLLITAEFIGIIAQTACHGAKVCILSKKFRHRNIRLNDLLAVVIGIHTKHASSSAV